MGKDLQGKELGKNIRQKPNGRFEARAMINGMTISVSGKKLSDVKIAFAKKVELAQHRVNANKQDITLDEWFDEWFERYKAAQVKPSSYLTLKRSYKNIFGNYIGKKKLSNLNTDMIQNIINLHHEEGKAASTVRNGLSMLQQCLDMAEHNKYIEVNPCYKLFVGWEREGQGKKIRFLSKEEQERFLKEIVGTWYEEMFKIMFLTGMRIGEVGGLKWSDIDYEHRCINIQRSLSSNYDAGVKKIFLNTPKTPNSYRMIPFIQDCGDLLKSQKQKQDKLRKELGDRWRGEGELDGLVFTTTMGSPVTKYVAERTINKLVEVINQDDSIKAATNGVAYREFKRFSPHVIRHTFATRCFESGIHPKVVQRVMGHAHYSTTIDVYTHLTSAMMDEELQKFGNVVSDAEALAQLYLPEAD